MTWQNLYIQLCYCTCSGIVHVTIALLDVTPSNPLTFSIICFVSFQKHQSRELREPFKTFPGGESPSPLPVGLALHACLTQHATQPSTCSVASANSSSQVISNLIAINTTNQPSQAPPYFSGKEPGWLGWLVDGVLVVCCVLMDFMWVP